MAEKFQSALCVMATFLILTGCFTTERIIFGIHRPKAENAESLAAFLDKHKMNSAENFATDTTGYLTLMNYGDCPEIMVFDKNLNYINYKALPDAKSPSCNAGAGVFLSALNTARTYETSTQYNFNTVVSHLRTFDGKKVEPGSIKKNDFIVLMTWVKWGGNKLFNKHNVDWYNAVKNNKNCSITVLMVNLDLQENWGKEAIKKYKPNIK